MSATGAAWVFAFPGEPNPAAEGAEQGCSIPSLDMQMLKQIESRYFREDGAGRGVGKNALTKHPDLLQKTHE